MAHHIGFRSAVLLASLVLIGGGCGGESGPITTTAGTGMAAAPSSTTTVASTPAATTSTTTVELINDEHTPVGGDEFHDSMRTTSEAKRLLDDVVTARSRGELDLAGIDGFWETALARIDDREDLDVVDEVLTILADEREARLNDLPPAIEQHAEVVAAALVDRDFESRVAAYEVLDELLRQGGDLGAGSNTIDRLHHALEVDVKEELIRRDTLTSGRVGSELDPSSLPSLPDDLLLVQWSDGFYWSDIVVLVDLNGVPLGYLDHHSLIDTGHMTIADGEVIYGAAEPAAYDDTTEGCIPAFVAENRTYLICDDMASYENAAWRAEVRVEYADGTVERLGGAGFVEPEANPNDPVVGHWRALYPSPDGSAVLGQWSGECEVPSAHMIYDGVVSAGFGWTDEISPESWALGWRDDGLALVAATFGACSSETDSGVFTWSPQGDVEPLYSTTTGGVIARLIRPNDPLGG